MLLCVGYVLVVLARVSIRMIGAGWWPYVAILPRYVLIGGGLWIAKAVAARYRNRPSRRFAFSGVDDLACFATAVFLAWLNVWGEAPA